MKRLFQVSGQYFDNKMEAKGFRDSNGGHVSKGPDHMGNHGARVPDTRHRGPRDANGHRNSLPDLSKRAAKKA